MRKRPMSDDNVTAQLETLMQTEEGKNFIELQKAGLVTKNQELLGKLKEGKTSLEAYQSLGDLETVTNTLQSAQQKEQDRLDTDSEAKQKHLETQLDSTNGELTAIRNKLVQDTLTNELSMAVKAAKGDESVLMPLLKQSLKGEYSEEGAVISVLENGETAHREGERMTIEALVQEAKAKHPNLFEVGAKGSGTLPNQKGEAGNATFDMGSEDFNMTKAAERHKRNGSYESVTKKFGWRS
jgi:hypothetical protein